MLSRAGSVFRAVTLGFVAVSVLAAVPLAALRVGRRLLETVPLAGEDARGARERILGASFVASLDAIRRVIPADGEYLMVDGGEELDCATYWAPALAPPLAALPVGLALVLLLSWRAHIPESFERATSLSLLWPGIVTRIPQLARDVCGEMVRFTNWGLFWPVALLVLAAGWRGLRRRPALPLLLAAGVPLGVGWIYATISLRPDFMVQATWDRFLLQASVPLLVLFALGLRDLLRRAPWVPRALGGLPSHPPGSAGVPPATNFAFSSPPPKEEKAE